MHLNALGYVGIRTKNLDDWAAYGTHFLGMQLVDKSRGTLALRMDDRKQRVIVHTDEDEGPSFYGWEVADAAALDALAAHLEKNGVKVARGSRALADERRVKDLIVFADPVGNRLEVFHGAEIATDPFKPGRSISGFRTGPLGMGHAVLTAERLDDVVPFYTEILNFKPTDYILEAVQGVFLSPQSAPPQPRLHRHRQERHPSPDGRGLLSRRCRPGLRSRAAQAGDDRHHARPPRQRSRHLVLLVFAVEILVRIRLGRPHHRYRNWTPQERTEGPSLWGHDRMWLTQEGREEARHLRINIAEAGGREPVNVMDGNYLRAADVCPWWNANVPARKTG